MRLHVLQHVPFEGPGSIETWAARTGHPLARTRLYANDPLPSIDAFDGLIVLGGPMGAHDEATLPWLVAEKRLIEQAIRAGRTVLGICLGAQLIADVLGARVYRNSHAEIGWFPIQRPPQALDTVIGRLLPPELDVFHWHGDTFDLPAGAVHLARSVACANQAFLYSDRVLALQFHLETTPASARALLDNCGADLTAGPCIQSADAMLADASRFQRINELMNRLLDALAR